MGKRGESRLTLVYELSNWKNGNYCGWGKFEKVMPRVQYWTFLVLYLGGGIEFITGYVDLDILREVRMGYLDIWRGFNFKSLDGIFKLEYRWKRKEISG